jgi:hypothetical protein
MPCIVQVSDWHAWTGGDLPPEALTTPYEAGSMSMEAVMDDRHPLQRGLFDESV